MNAPDKPWESNTRLQNIGLGPNAYSAPGYSRMQRGGLNSNSPQTPYQVTGPQRSTTLPNVPPRPPQLSTPTINSPSQGFVPNMYGGYGGGPPYSAYGIYPGTQIYGGYPRPYGYGPPNNTIQSRFMQAAQESSHSAFQSIESLVRAFSSVSMMLESTYHALYSSFHAILGVVDNFSRLRQLFTEFLSAITFLKIIHNFYRRFLYWLGVIKQNPQTDDVWNSVTSEMPKNTASTSSWPLFTFLGMLIGGPYFISKFCQSNGVEKWDSSHGYLIEAAYPYDATSSSELGFSQNEIIIVAPKKFQQSNSAQIGWVLAANRKGQVGYIPVSRLGSKVVRLSRQNEGNEASGNSSTQNQTS